MIRSRVWWAAAVGVLLGLAALTRSVVWPVPFVLAPLVLLTMHRSRTMHGSRHWRAAGAAALLVAGHVAVIAPWAVRNTRLQGTVTIVETMGAENLRMGNYEHTPMDRMWDAISLTGPKHWAADLWIEHPDAIHWTEGQKAQWAQTKAVEYMVQHPGLTVRRSIQKFSDFWGLEREFVAGVQKGLYNPPVWFALAAIAAIGVSYPIVALGAAIGVFRAPPSSRSTHWMILTLAAVMVAIHTVVFGHSRYHLPLVPFLAIYAGAVLAGSLWKGPLFTWRNAGPATAILALLAIWTHEILGRDSGRIRELISPLM
jgi:4-amino-4-deoxy-L-arabinose transferase-like glycosyltransferase